MEKWTREKAWEWKNSRPWIVGFNYVASNCASRYDMWQKYEHNKKVPVFERELATAREWGFNSVRIIPPFEVWLEERDTLLRYTDEFMTIADKNGMDSMIIFGNDCTLPKDQYERPKPGPQQVAWGYHGGVIRSPHAGAPEPGYSLIDEPELAEKHVLMLKEFVGEFRCDRRVCVWDIFNEPGNGRRGTRSLAHMERLFDEARMLDPVQPLTACVWTMKPGRELPEIERRAMELSDIISYHDYADYETSVYIISQLKKEGRPLLNTEWLNRIQGNNVQSHLPLYWLEEVGLYNWGLVAGLNQTYEPWEASWKRYYKGECPHYDFTKWMHDLIRPSLRPYDPHEMDMFRKYAAISAEEFNKMPNERV